jgi:RepB DNA-primase from phage plasmid
MDFNPLVVDEPTVRRFVDLIHTRAARAVNGSDAGILQLVSIHPADGSISVSRYCVGDVEHMTRDAIASSAAGHNVYVEGRTVRADLRGNKRGDLKDTLWVFALVIDSDNDKGKAWTPTVQASIIVETSPGNAHFWFCLARAVNAADGKAIGERMRKSTGADQDTGVVTQCYRVAGTPNFPSASKRKRGRVLVEPTKIIEQSEASLEDALAAFAEVDIDVDIDNVADRDKTSGGANGDESELPADLLQLIQNGVAAGEDRSAAFHSVVAQLKRRHWSAEAIVDLLEKYPNGIAAKYSGRLREEVERSYGKHAGNGGSGGAGGVSPGVAPRTLPTIRVVAGELPRIVSETEQALLAAGAPIFVRAGVLVRPVIEKMMAADGRKTTIASLCPFTVPAMLDWIASAALLERFDARRKRWATIDPPRAVAEALLSRKGLWSTPYVSGVITTPTLRSDGSLLAEKGYDAETGLYLWPGFELPPMPKPTRAAAKAGLALLSGLFEETPFLAPLDRSVALSGVLTALVRGVMPTAPMYLIRAHTPGTGKSYVVDIIAGVATGQTCPVITTTTSNEEEVEKRLGSVVLSGAALVSIDNCTRDLGGELLCQLAERALVRIRILGRSEMPICQCHTAIFATGNNVIFRGDMVRRGLVCNLDAATERPELRQFQHDPLQAVLSDRAPFVAAALTIMRAYLAAGSPRVCNSVGSYADWSRMVRSPLIWLGQPDPVESMSAARAEDPELNDIRELFTLWSDELHLDERYTTARIIEVACEPAGGNDYNRKPLKELLLRVAGERNGREVSAKRLGWWLRRISGRVEAGCRLGAGRLNEATACFWLSRV